MKKNFVFTSLVAIAMSCPAMAATDVTFSGTYNGGLELKEPADVTYSYNDAKGNPIDGVASSTAPDKTKFTYTGTDGNETNLDAGNVPTQSEYTAQSSASGVVSGPSELVSGMILDKSAYSYENSAGETVTLGDAPLDVVETITLSNEAGTEITVKNDEGATEQISGKMYSFTTVDGIELTLNDDATGVLRDGLGGTILDSAEDIAEFERVKGLYEDDKQELEQLITSTANAYQIEKDNFNSANDVFVADTATLGQLNDNFATVGTATSAYDVALQAQSAAQATYAENDALYQAAKKVYDAPILETITNGANDAIDSALAQGGAIRSELDVNATAIADNKTAIETNATNIAANSDAISAEKTRAETVEAQLDGKIGTNTANIAANKTAIETNATNIATNATNIAANKTAIESEVARATAAEAQLDGKIALNTAAIEEEVANRIAGDEMTLSAAKAYADAKNTMSLKSAYDYTDKKVGALEEELSAGIASAAAMSSVAVSNVAKGEVSVGGGYGYYNSQSAVALGAAMGLTDNWSVNAAAGLSDSNVTFRAGTNYKFKLF